MSKKQTSKNEAIQARSKVMQASKQASDNMHALASLDRAWLDIQNMLKPIIFNAYTLDNENRPIWLSFFSVSFDVTEYSNVFSGKPVVATIRLIEFTRNYEQESGKRTSTHIGRVLVNMESGKLTPFAGFKLSVKNEAMQAIRKAHKHTMKHHIAWSDLKANKWNIMAKQIVGTASNLLESESVDYQESTD